MERLKFEDTEVVRKFKEWDGEFNKLDVFFSKLERSSASSLMLHEESSMACRIMKLVQNHKENNIQ